MLPTLRPYQTDLLERTSAALHAHQRVLMVLPTGGGKTEIFLHAAIDAAASGQNVLIAVHRVELLNQTSRRMQHRHGLIRPGIKTRSPYPIQIGTIQTVARRARHYSFDLIILDEAHHATAKTWEQVLAANPAARVLGVTATPCRLSGKPLVDTFAAIEIGPSIADLISDGYLVEPEVYAPSGIDLSSIKRTAGDYNRAQLQDATDKPTITGCAVEHYRKLAPGQPAVAFCVSIAHAAHVADAFRAAGYSAASIDGTMSGPERDSLIRALASGQLQVLTSCDLISEGVDVPVIGCGILLRPTQSTALYLQQVGRCLRPYPGKTKAIILDHVGNCARHGLPDDPRQWSLAKGIVPASSESAPQFRVRTCDSCLRTHRFAPKCPACGYVYPRVEREVEQVEGELEKVKRELYADADEVVESMSCSTFDDLIDMELRRDKPIGWAIKIYRSRGGALDDAEEEHYANRRAEGKGYKQGWVSRWLETRRNYRRGRVAV